jgi:hypothetical protein
MVHGSDCKASEEKESGFTGSITENVLFYKYRKGRFLTPPQTIW